MSLGVNLLAALVKRVAQSLDDSFDIEILEMHHKAKIDAPSGTAFMLGEAAAAGRNVALDQTSARGRDGITGERKTGDIGFASLRGGTIAGDHTVIFAGPHERIEIYAQSGEPHAVRTGRAEGGDVGAWQEARLLFDGRRARARRYLTIFTDGSNIMSDRLLVLVRHGQSEWNLKNLFTGWKDPDLTELGVTEAKAAGRRLKDQGLTFDIAFTSDLKRAQRTLDLALAEMGQTGLPITRDHALNERDYGELSGLNKDDAAPNGARSRSMSGGARSTCRRPAAKA